MRNATLLFLFFIFQSCTFERSDLSINITNCTEKTVYIGNLYSGCDSCDMVRDVSLRFNVNGDLRVINSGETCHLVDKLLLDTISEYAINSDSLYEYWKKAEVYNIMNKPWVKKISGKVYFKNKTCTILIK
jgi:hypothetical protein